jgi:hypothetical protein
VRRCWFESVGLTLLVRRCWRDVVGWTLLVGFFWGWVRGLVLSINNGRPSSMYMLCPHEIGLDSWNRGGQESVVRPDLISPQDLGGISPNREESSSCGNGVAQR